MAPSKMGQGDEAHPRRCSDFRVTGSVQRRRGCAECASAQGLPGSGGDAGHASGPQRGDRILARTVGRARLWDVLGGTWQGSYLRVSDKPRFPNKRTRTPQASRRGAGRRPPSQLLRPVRAVYRGRLSSPFGGRVFPGAGAGLQVSFRRARDMDLQGGVSATVGVGIVAFLARTHACCRSPPPILAGSADRAPQDPAGMRAGGPCSVAFCNQSWRGLLFSHSEKLRGGTLVLVSRPDPVRAPGDP